MFQKWILRHFGGFTNSLAGRWLRINNWNLQLYLLNQRSWTVEAITLRWLLNYFWRLNVQRQRGRRLVSGAVSGVNIQGPDQKTEIGLRISGDVVSGRLTQRRRLWSPVILIFLAFTGPSSAALREPLKVQVHTMDSTRINFQATTQYFSNIFLSKSQLWVDGALDLNWINVDKSMLYSNENWIQIHEIHSILLNVYLVSIYTVRAKRAHRFFKTVNQLNHI